MLVVKELHELEHRINIGGFEMYIFTYWLKGQSKLFSYPQKAMVEAEMLELAIHTCIENGYEIESIVKAENA